MKPGDNESRLQEKADEFARQFGFKDNKELVDMVIRVDLSTGGKLSVFKEWQLKDGTRDGLQKILDEQERSLHEDEENPPL